MPRTVPKSTRLRSLTGRVSKNAMFSRSASSTGSSGSRLIALRSGCPTGLTGQASTHSPQPVQSSAYTCSVYREPGRPAATSGAERKPSGASSTVPSG